MDINNNIPVAIKITEVDVCDIVTSKQLEETKKNELEENEIDDEISQ